MKRGLGVGAGRAAQARGGLNGSREKGRGGGTTSMTDEGKALRRSKGDKGQAGWILQHRYLN